MNRYLFTVLPACAALLIGACGDDSSTGSDTGAVAPQVGSTSPIHLTTAVARNAPITASFSKAMDPATLDGTTFMLRTGTTILSATVTYSGTTALLTPAITLAPNTNYTASVSTRATDLQGRALAATKTWSFTTVATSPSGPAAVNLGTAGSFVVLAKSAISTTGTTLITGNIGLSPAAATFITGFALSAPPTTFTTSGIVTGQIRASDYDAPTPTNLTTAVLDMQTAYTDAAGRTLPDFVELGAGSIDGLTLTAGLYKWGTGVELANGVTLAGDAGDIWIFQIAQDLTVGNGAIVTLSGGAQAKNIFWQVAGQATLGTTSVFKGILLSKTLIALNTGAVLTGRALAQTAVTLDATAVISP